MDSSSSLLHHPDPDDEDASDADITDPPGRRGTWGYGQGGRSKSQDALGDWFKLKWWRKRWREDDDRDEAEDEGEEERRQT
jgi:hypothetical protein